MNQASVALITVICILLVVTLFFIVGTSGKQGIESSFDIRGDDNTTIPAPAATAQGDVVITEENINYGTEYLVTDICIPVVSGFSDAQFEQELNDRIKKQIALANAAAKEATTMFVEDIKAKGYEPWAYIFYTRYSVKCVDGFLSMGVTTFLETGGTGMPNTVYYNADIKRNKHITLDDLFSDDTAYKERIKDMIIHEMDKDSERYFAADSFTGITEKTQFFITEGKLYIAFAKYQVASGMTGEPEFLIPTEAISDIIAPEYADLFV